MDDTPSRLDEELKRMSLTCLIASSSGPVRSRSMSSAEAPGSAVTMLTQLKLISGSCARGMER